MHKKLNDKKDLVEFRKIYSKRKAFRGRQACTQFLINESEIAFETLHFEQIFDRSAAESTAEAQTERKQKPFRDIKYDSQETKKDIKVEEISDRNAITFKQKRSMRQMKYAVPPQGVSRSECEAC